ncbi:hypothetical protein FH972_021713 [Carpinus fangiana]|uniref:VOC domain-containing protein n=1 Tax=Carpinus fangiana TaxID=176857 RepID=A0A5N6KQH3_9ROSI|nr:hypothetical protein FH972_021713 [Carpinus fangiana]
MAERSTTNTEAHGEHTNAKGSESGQPSLLTSLQAPARLGTPFLGKVIEICIVTPDADRTMDGLLALGIGPFKVFSFTPETVANQTWRGQPSAFSLKVCFATQGELTWELMQPVAGPSIMANFLAQKGEGVHHVAFDCDGASVVDRVRSFEARGFPCIQSGCWKGANGTCEFRFFDTDGAIGSCFETYDFSSDWEEPEDAEVYPPVSP